MSGITLHLQDAMHSETIEQVSSFVGEDASGSFGLLAGHERFMTSLVFGLARFRVQGSAWEYLALPGALLYFVDDHLYLNTRRLLRDSDYERITAALEDQLLAEEHNLRGVKDRLHNMEQEMFKRLWRMEREPRHER